MTNHEIRYKVGTKIQTPSGVFKITRIHKKEMNGHGFGYRITGVGHRNRTASNIWGFTNINEAIDNGIWSIVEEPTMTKVKREKIGNGYHQGGYGRGYSSRPTVWLIDGKAYAKHKTGASLMYTPLTGDLEGYVPVNIFNKDGVDGYGRFFEVGTGEEHRPHTQGVIEMESAPRELVKEYKQNAVAKAIAEDEKNGLIQEAEIGQAQMSRGRLIKTMTKARSKKYGVVYRFYIDRPFQGMSGGRRKETVLHLTEAEMKMIQSFDLSKLAFEKIKP